MRVKVKATAARVHFFWRAEGWQPYVARTDKVRYETPIDGIAGEPCPESLPWPETRPSGLAVSRVRRFPLEVPESGTVIGKALRTEGTYHDGRQHLADDWDPPYTTNENRMWLQEVVLDTHGPSGRARIVLVHPLDLLAAAEGKLSGSSQSNSTVQD